MRVRPDSRLADVPMTPVDCGACGARVQVRKSSWEQTSVQWDAASRDRCGRRDVASVGGRVPVPEDAFTLCPRLRESIETAVDSGRLPVLDETEPPDGGPEGAHAHRG